jgi:hypothetical protein
MVRRDNQTAPAKPVLSLSVGELMLWLPDQPAPLVLTEDEAVRRLVGCNRADARRDAARAALSRLVAAVEATHLEARGGELAGAMVAARAALESAEGQP